MKDNRRTGRGTAAEQAQVGRFATIDLGAVRMRRAVAEAQIAAIGRGLTLTYRVLARLLERQEFWAEEMRKIVSK